MRRDTTRRDTTQRAEGENGFGALGPNDGMVMVWGGLRGAVGLALAIIVDEELHDHGLVEQAISITRALSRTNLSCSLCAPSSSRTAAAATTRRADDRTRRLLLLLLRLLAVALSQREV